MSHFGVNRTRIPLVARREFSLLHGWYRGYRYKRLGNRKRSLQDQPGSQDSGARTRIGIYQGCWYVGVSVLQYVVCFEMQWLNPVLRCHSPEPDLAVLDYLRLTLGDRYALSLFSEEKSLLDRLEQNDEPDILLLALHSGS